MSTRRQQIATGLASVRERIAAACRKAGRDADEVRLIVVTKFFPVSDVGPGARQTEQAKAVCARCPVRAQCLEYALDNALDHGIYGGTTESERRTLRRQAVRKAA